MHLPWSKKAILEAGGLTALAGQSALVQEAERKIGEMLLRDGFVSKRQLREMYGESLQSGKPLKPIVIKDKQVPTDGWVKIMIEEQGSKFEVGDKWAFLQPEARSIAQTLLQAGSIDDRQLDEAYKESLRTGKTLGQVLFDKKIVPASEIIQAMMASQKTGYQPQVAPEAIVAGMPQPSTQGVPKTEGKGRTAVVKLKVAAKNADQVGAQATLTITPPVRTSLEIEESVSPDKVPEDEPTEVTYKLLIRNTKRATGRNIMLDLEDLPEWFQISKVMIDSQTVSHSGDKRFPLKVGDILPGQCETVAVIGVASPMGG